MNDHDQWVVPVGEFMRIGAADLSFDAQPTECFVQLAHPCWHCLININGEAKEITVASMHSFPIEMTIEQFRECFKLEPREVGEDLRCDICNVKAPRVFGFYPSRMPRPSDVDSKVWPHSYIPDLIVSAVGWAKFFWPWPEPWPEATTIPEHKNACPSCAEKVARYVAHLTKPALDEADL